MNEKKCEKKFVRIMLTVTVLFLVISVFFSLNVSAHPASDMSISYEYDTQKLSVEITHNVGDPADHYIDNLTIRKNNEIYQIYNYTSQPSDSSFTYTFNVSASKGDEIEVYTHCNKGGDLTKKLTVTSTGTTKTESELTAGDIAFYSIFGFPLIGYIGIITLVLFISIAALAVLKRHGYVKYPLKLHIWLAYIAIILALIHGIIGILLYV